MISAELKLHDTDKSRRVFFAKLLRGFYGDLLEQGLPEPLARLVQQMDAPGAALGHVEPKLALVVEANEQSRMLAVALLEETELDVVECASGEAALGLLHHRGEAVVFVFADEHLAGPCNGAKLAREISERWPAISLVLTKDRGSSHDRDLPEEIIVLQKPWLGLDLLLAAERAAQPA